MDKAGLQRQCNLQLVLPGLQERARSEAVLSNSAKLCSYAAAASLDREMSEDRSRMEAWNRTEYSELLIITLDGMFCSASRRLARPLCRLHLRQRGVKDGVSRLAVRRCS